MSIWEKMNETEPGSGATPWIAEDEGDMMVIEVTALTEGNSEYGPFNMAEGYPLGEDGARTGEDEVSVAFMGAVLSNWYAKHSHELVKGAQLAVRYDGMQKGSGPNEYKGWTAMIQPPASLSDKMSATEKMEGDDLLPF